MVQVASVVLLLCSLSQLSCQPNDPRFTEEESSRVVKLRNELINLADLKIEEIRGSTQTGEGYVLMYGYSRKDHLNQLPISSTLVVRLQEIFPPQREIYVLAHFQDDRILEYTSWENNGKRLAPHRDLETPFVVEGSAYVVRVKDYGHVEISN